MVVYAVWYVVRRNINFIELKGEKRIEINNNMHGKGKTQYDLVREQSTFDALRHLVLKPIQSYCEFCNTFQERKRKKF